MQRLISNGAPRAIQQTLSDFLKRVSQASTRALILNFDGLLEHYPNSGERVEPGSEELAVLRKLRQDTDIRLVVITGRPAARVAQWLGLPGTDIWGCHGLERLRADGAVDKAEVPAETLDAIGEATGQLLSDGLGPFAESKYASIAIHWRGQEEEAGRLTRRVLHAWSTIKNRKGVLLVPFDSGLEIMASARNRGDVVQTVLSEIGSDSAVAYLGGETNDEDGFAALRGRGLNVLVREQYRRSLADVWVRPRAEVRDFLNSWIAECKTSVPG